MYSELIYTVFTKYKHSLYYYICGLEKNRPPRSLNGGLNTKLGIIKIALINQIMMHTTLITQQKLWKSDSPNVRQLHSTVCHVITQNVKLASSWGQFGELD